MILRWEGKVKLRFVLLRHDCPADYRDGPHWDLMVERPGVEDERRLATWSLRRLPAAWAESLGLAPEGASSVEATALADHRAAYLDYEGDVSGGRGSVRRVAAGAVAWSEHHDGDAEGVVELAISGATPLAGVATLTLLGGDRWRLECRVSA